MLSCLYNSVVSIGSLYCLAPPTCISSRNVFPKGINIPVFFTPSKTFAAVDSVEVVSTSG